MKNIPVIVLDRVTAAEVCSKLDIIDGNTLVISIRSCGDPYRSYTITRDTSPWIKDVIHLVFDDVETDCMPENPPINEGQARAIVKFCMKNIDDDVDQIIVHCDAGVSRSAGVAAAITKWYYNEDEQFFNNSQYVPNMRCYRYVLNAFVETLPEEN